MQKEKKIFWSILFFCLVGPLVIPLNISLQLLFNSLACVCLGSIYSIKLIKNEKEKNIKRTEHESDDEDDTVSMEDALKFPFYASFALCVLYVLFKNIDKDLLNYLFKINFGMMGVSCLGGFILDQVEFIMPSLKLFTLLDKKIDFAGIKQHLFFTSHNIFAYLLASVVSGMYVYTNHWTLNNILGISFTIAGIMLLKVSKFEIVFLLLWLLFFYDIFWVFKSDLMITVAKNFDVPIKLVLPLANGKKSILGLGDMVIPGVLVALALKFDVDLGLEKFSKLDEKMKSSFVFEKPHFWSCVVGYALGIISTFVSMILMEHAQPALLYLVPWCCVSLVFQCIVQGTVKRAYYYEAQPKVEEKKKD